MQMHQHLFRHLHDTMISNESLDEKELAVLTSYERPRADAGDIAFATTAVDRGDTLETKVRHGAVELGGQQNCRKIHGNTCMRANTPTNHDKTHFIQNYDVI